MAPSPDAPEPAPASARAAVQQPSGTGIALVLGCYTLWGVFPLYFRLLAEAGSVEIIGHRIVWTLATCLGLVAVRRRWGRLRRVLRSARLLGALAVSGLLVSVNWLIYVYGINTGRTADAALGYFINPLVTVALAALVLRERLRPVHRVSIGLATAAVALLVVLQGSLPWISLALALSFGLYGLVKKRIGPQVDALTGLTVESAVVCPAAAAYLGRLAWQGQSAWQDPHAGALVFIEVKCRSGLGFGDPLEAVTWRKRRKLRQLCLLWLAEHRIRVDCLRIDAIGVLLRPGEKPAVNHVRGIEE